MSSVLFRQIGPGERAGKPERLFLAAVTAFCSLQRPSRREIAQVDDLTGPLFGSVSREALRFAAAALSECEYGPPALIGRLCDQPVDICAALLIRSRSLKDIDLIGLIGRHGLPHARAIARRADLNQSIVDLIEVLLEAEPGQQQGAIMPAPEEKGQKPAMSSTTTQTGQSHSTASNPPSAAEAVRDRLRGMMRPGETSKRKTRTAAWGREATAYDKLRSTAFSGVPELFQTALADTLGLTLRQARQLTDHSCVDDLSTALNAIGLSSEEAFVVTAAILPSRFGHPESIRLFLERFEAIDREVARENLRAWKGDTLAVTLPRALKPQNANRPAGRATLKAS